jgi:hypothetical protein
MGAGRQQMRRLGSLLFFVATFAPVSTPAQTGEQGSVCVHNFAPGISCDSTDVLVEDVVLGSVTQSCGVSGTAQVVLDVVLSASVSRYDIGTIIALDGKSALSGGQCYHDYLAAPLSDSPTYGDDYADSVPDIRNGPWHNLEPFDTNDFCGDIQANTETIQSLKTASIPLTIDCDDTNDDPNGWVDVSVCTSWRVGTTGGQATCNALSEAVPSTSQRCSCSRVDIVPEPDAALALASGAALLAALRRRSA